MDIAVTVLLIGHFKNPDDGDDDKPLTPTVAILVQL